MSGLDAFYVDEALDHTGTAVGVFVFREANLEGNRS
jgi:hypothetical protein